MKEVDNVVKWIGTEEERQMKEERIEMNNLAKWTGTEKKKSDARERRKDTTGEQRDEIDRDGRETEA